MLGVRRVFDRILIANRGEIACRVIDTCRRLGVGTVAVYSDADANARHVAMADTSVRIGPAPSAESYLRGDRIIEAAIATGAQAIHPGYGFLSENPQFVEQVEAAGLAFIGPSAPAIRAMGLKDAAKALMAEAGVPIVPGYHGSDQAPAHLAQEAANVGYPVLIKARAGGGGKGMRLVETPETFAENLAACQREAAASFGDDAVLIEKFITSPRHIEVQVFGDGTSAVHLYERDCSLQRRHQKVIEEAPAPGMTPEMRVAMGAAAVRAAEAIGYAGAGTVEFIVDGSGPLRPDGFWFMEMNTRLQVEHPITEAVTGIDLVEWQLRVAAGEPLPLAQADIPLTGHAMEARLYAEDAERGFLPATGTLTTLDFPATLRADTGVRAGDTISPHYDPMIAKLIAHGPTRDAARLALLRGLEETRIAGSTTNLSFLAALLRDPDFASGTVDTGLIARRGDTLTQMPEASEDIIALAGILLMGLDTLQPHMGFTLWAPLKQSITLEHRGEIHTLAVEPLSPGKARINGREITFQSDGKTAQLGSTRFGVARHGDTVTVFHRATPYTFTRPDPLAIGQTDATDANHIAAPMPGLVKAVMTTEGASVTKGDPLVILEAMKMEHTLRAPRDGTVGTLATAEGTQVADGDILLTLAEAAE
ncbi:MAG: acetyl/propionyl/methylcrotonyl-CoA carboxylase subunit alpha [Pseudomonadota bacterium]